jgi:hypothetical protein
MAASQDVVKAVNGGAIALTAGALVVIVSFAMVPIIVRMAPTEVTPAQNSDTK